MALGEFISVSSQRDSETSQLAVERWELAEMPDEELAELARTYRNLGLSSSTAMLVASELTAHDALAAHAHAELGINPNELANAWHASLASAVAFTLGAILPLTAILLAPAAWRVPVTVLSVLSALALTGVLSSRLGRSRAKVAVARVVLGGAAGLALTYAIGRLFGSAVG
jgi:VIT1/CCC1 family predicted Fe2+/Mn2+ transporter